ncbi:MAG TPA: PQQ-dependent dehydrogenase, methanol/ethanol family [Vicinamibacterales bacterium]|nr:PQQ-dependent dehydrogenase, methanol/ethanol family [Vicinamibacterales bacterium]
MKLQLAVAVAGAIAGAVAVAAHAQQSDPGRTLYDQTCVSCHGPSGQGDRAPALNTGRFAHGTDDADLARVIRSGVPGSQMPPFAALTEDQVRQLVAYIRGLAPPTAPATATPSPDTFVDQSMDADGAWQIVDKLTGERRRLVTGQVTPARLEHADAEPQNWLMYWGDYRATHYSALKQIDATNVGQLRAAWTFPMPGPSVLEAAPVVVDGVMYTTQPGVVVALDAKTGRQLWRFTRQQKVKNPYEINPFNRGVAVVGRQLFVGTLDAALLALDATTGRLLWDVQVADSMLGYSLTSAPLIVKDKVLVGITGGEFGARGFLDAYDIATGKRLWRWYSVPATGEFGNDTWKGDSWKRGGSPMWLTGSYDPALNLVYWTVGNPGPQIDRSVRGDLDNLFSDSVIAFDPDTGERKWHYQFTPNDGHDWDSCQAVVLVDRVWHGRMRKLLLHADRNGLFYVLDRTNGAFLSATPFVYQNWNAGFDERGRPLAVPGSNSSPEGSFFVYPTVGGATNFQAPSYSPLTGWLYLEYREGGQPYVSSPVTYEAGRQYIGRVTPPTGAAAAPKAGEPPASAGIKALDPETGKTMWDFKISQGSLTNGVLATASNVLFAAVRDGNLIALDAKSGAHLWHFATGTNMAASPISYAVDSTQYVAIAAGNTVYAFALPESHYTARTNGDVVRLDDHATHTSVSIVPSAGHKATEMIVNGHNVLATNGIPFLGPWANRLDEQAFYANGRRYALDMSLGNIRGGDIPIHGFLTTATDWRVVETKADDDAAWVTSRLDVSTHEAWMKQWPFAHTIEMTYRLHEGALEVRTSIANTGHEAMPVAIGFHPYFQLTDSPRDEWTIAVGARTHWKLSDKKKIPTGETEPAALPAALRTQVLDDVFSDLVRDAEGRATMTVKGKSQRIDVDFGPKYRAAVVWAPKPGEFICFEPMAGITDALNLAHRGIYKELQSIAPGATWTESFWIRPSGF